MRPARRAVIDVGTNSIKLLVADVLHQEVRPVIEQSTQTRLGAGFYQTHHLRAEAIASTAQAIARFAETAHKHETDFIRVVATSAARDAKNAGELIKAIETAAGLKVEIISGEQEADWAFQGVTSDPRLRDATLLLLDVGGGSTEFILGRGQQKHFRASFPLGTVRLLEQMPHQDPPQLEELQACRQRLSQFLRREVAPQLEPALKNEEVTASSRRSILLVGAGGTATILARMETELEEYDRQRIEDARLSLDRMRWHVERLWSLPLAERKKIIGLPANRADVILTGVAIYEAIMEHFKFGELRISTRGLRFAAVMQPPRVTANS